MAEHHLLPYQILCSSALRTRETLAGLLPCFNGEAEILIRRDLYDAAGLDYTSIIRESATNAKRLMVIGHNPATQATALNLAGSGNPALIEEISEKFPTAALAVIDFDAPNWKAIKAGSGRIVSFVKPRDLRE